jgi:hypothetical protein
MYITTMPPIAAAYEPAVTITIGTWLAISK